MLSFLGRDIPSPYSFILLSWNGQTALSLAFVVLLYCSSFFRFSIELLM
jgi:hypothetical protein